VDLQRLGERSLVVDCDVLQADGGTRTASITGGCLALMQAIGGLIQKKVCPPEVFLQPVAAVSVGMVQGRLLLDLCYEEDSVAEVDMNVVMTADGRLVEIQGTAEHQPFTFRQMEEMLELARQGIRELVRRQKAAARALHLPWKG